MAQVLLQKILSERGLQASVRSAGTDAADGGAASAHAVQAMREYGLDLSDHRAARLTAALIDEADLILTMSARHKEAVRELRPQAVEKTFVLTEFVGEADDVADPFGQDVEAYRNTAKRLRELLEKAVERLSLSGQGNSENA